VNGGCGTVEADRPIRNAEQLRAQIGDSLQVIERLADTCSAVHNAAELEQAEREIFALTDQLAGLLIGYHIQRAVNESGLTEQARQLAQEHPKRFKSEGKRSVHVTPARGLPVEVFTSYWRRKGGGIKPKAGLYPELILLGIHDRRTPLASAQIALWASAMSSLQEAAQMLRHQGWDIDIKSLRTLTYRYAQRARAATEAQALPLTEQAAGRRIAISLDGGRIRIRTDKHGKKTSKGRKRYHTKWREPKLLHIWALDAQGHIDREFCPLIDGSLQGPDMVFMLLRYYLRQLNIQEADTILLIADGAPWIWKRFEVLLADFSLDRQKVFQLIDFYHAVEHLSAFAGLRRGWSAKYRKQWVTKHRHLLRHGKIDQVIEAVCSACRGKCSKRLTRERNYFANNRDRFKYQQARRRRLPIGSGPMESAIRRVVNLRLKGAGIFWHEENADAMLLLRSYYKAGRWNMLIALVRSAPLEAYL